MSNEQPTPRQPSGQPGAYGPPAAYGPYGQQPPPYGQQPPPYGQPGAHPRPGAYPPPGAQPQGWTGGPPPYPYDPYQPAGMPGSVRAAQIVIFATFGIGVLLTVVTAATVGAEEAGRFFSTYLMALVLFVLAFQYRKAGNGVRVASIVLASVQILFALSAAAQGVPLGIVPLGTAVAVIVLLSQGSAGQWFRRQRVTGTPPPYAR
ncbi:hypothetical protein GCM10010293_25090 [Streptomyces griseoflavus]|uniref:hypothetical protein n=1 Tax=Streptomyces griseoflavus TaxID=35619 RepID=UPI00167E9168|nr:hypothetical protein [Streptomyces griseoflavus]GGV26511.1 hypothetical protein GCM10010293_25090 [Streptomyces griseoflavus]